MTKLVGILNVTPDSFSDGGKFFNKQCAMAQAKKLFNDGADIVDVGAESTRPGATPLMWQEEWQRLEPVLTELLKLYPGKISLDTYHPETLEKALQFGSVIANDITGLKNQKMFEIVTQNNLFCIAGEIPANDVQSAHHGTLLDDIKVVIQNLTDIYEKLVRAGLPKNNIILDPCIGFGKTPRLNWQLLEIAKYLPNKQVMIGYSRKRFLGENRMKPEPNIKAGKIAIANGATYLRVHDVKSHKKLIESLLT